MPLSLVISAYSPDAVLASHVHIKGCEEHMPNHIPKSGTG